MGRDSETRTEGLPSSAKAFVALSGITAFLIVCSGYKALGFQVSTPFVLYLAIGIATAGMKVVIPGVPANLSVTYALTLLSILELPTPAALAITLVATVIQTFWNAHDRPKAAQIIFNLACITISVSAAAAVFHQRWFTSLPEGEPLRFALAAMSYFAVNTWMVSIVIGLSSRRDVLEVWRTSYSWSFAYYLLGALLIEMVHTSVERFGWRFTSVLAPLTYLIFRSYKVYLQKLEQEKSHAEEMSQLHMRTIEALAMAIEAKDECTSEHLRRVQVYSRKLAEELGLPLSERRAIEAAAILHDIGKLAVPDHIISKPGKLTPEEFERMKVHTVVGAAILEQVAFPYPVAPIVRSHHERWDGSGYPDGLQGDQIPIGARIISAVDCFDALASDRQYRRALPLDKAMDYLVSASGKNFDPRIVDVLKRNYTNFEASTLATPLRDIGYDKNALIVRGDAPGAGFEQNGTASAAGNAGSLGASLARQDIYKVFELAHEIGGMLKLQELLLIVSERLRQVVPFECLAVYLRENNVLKPKFVSPSFVASEMLVGNGVSGWVVEHNTPILNGTPSVEQIGSRHSDKRVELKSALSVPFSTEALAGALTLYHSQSDAYNKEHLAAVAALSGRISRALETALRLERPQHEGFLDDLTGLCNATSIWRRLDEALADGKPFTILICDLDNFKLIDDQFGRLQGNAFLKRVGEILQTNVRPGEAVARLGGDEFMLLLTGTNRFETRERAARLEFLVREAAWQFFSNVGVKMSVGAAYYPENGPTVHGLLAHADAELYRAKRKAKATDQNLVSTGAGEAVNW